MQQLCCTQAVLSIRQEGIRNHPNEGTFSPGWEYLISLTIPGLVIWPLFGGPEERMM